MYIYLHFRNIMEIHATHKWEAIYKKFLNEIYLFLLYIYFEVIICENLTQKIINKIKN